MKINSEGYIAIVHDAMSTYQDSIPWLVEEENTINWFRVFWDGDYPGSNETNTCEANSCKTTTDGNCLCKTTVTESVVFENLSITKEDVMSQLFIGALGPPDGSNATNITEDIRAHTVGDVVDEFTVFEVRDKGKTIYLKNIISMVSLQGWEMTPQIYEAEDATVFNAVSLANMCLHFKEEMTTFLTCIILYVPFYPAQDVRDDTSSATGGLYVYIRNGVNSSTYVEWQVDVPTTGEYLISLRYALDYSPRPLSVSLCFRATKFVR